MVNIAIVEDDKIQATQLETALKSYGSEKRLHFKISVFYSAAAFLGSYSPEYDIVFMDIMMPALNGMDAARLLREKDEKVMIIFVTNMQQYAIQGYEVGAFDFIVKPITYPELKLKFTRALGKLQPISSSILIRSESGLVRLMPQDIAYVEVRKHHCIYHTRNGEYRQYQTLKSAESQLLSHGFARCNNYLLVNLAYVTRVEDMTVFVNGDALQISHPRKKEFTAQVEAHFGGVTV